MTITKAQVNTFFQNLESDVEDIAENAEKQIAKAIALAGQFLRSTAAALAKDPVLLAAIQAGMKDAIASVSAAVEEGGTSALAGAASEAGRTLVINAGGTAEHQLVPIVVAELQAAVDGATQATPTHANP